MILISLKVLSLINNIKLTYEKFIYISTLVYNKRNFLASKLILALQRIFFNTTHSIDSLSIVLWKVKKKSK